MALALDDGFLALLAARLGEIADEFGFVLLRIKAEHPRADVVFVRAQNVIDLAITRAAHAVVRIMAIGKAGVVRDANEFVRGLKRIGGGKSRGRGARSQSGGGETGREVELSFPVRDDVHGCFEFAEDCRSSFTPSVVTKYLASMLGFSQAGTDFGLWT